MSKRPRVPATRRPRPPATIVDWIEQNKPSGEPLILSEPTKTWVDRMWHALLRVETSDDDFDELDKLFVAYLVGLEDQHEAELANACFTVLMDTVVNHWDTLPKCRGCGSLLCPHCGRHAEGPSAA